jgi:hypothetical protein
MLFRERENPPRGAMELTLGIQLVETNEKTYRDHAFDCYPSLSV